MERVIIYFVLTFVLIGTLEAQRNNNTKSVGTGDTAADTLQELDLDSPSKISLDVAFDDAPSSSTTGTIAKATPGDPDVQSNTARTSTIEPESNAISQEFYECPKDSETVYELMPTVCNSHKECKRLGENQICCKVFGDKRCVQGKVVQQVEQRHQPLLFIIPQRCPKRGETLAETWWAIQTCKSDQDCWPRLCCPDGDSKYCMAPQPELQSAPIPVARQLASPFEQITQYMQCTPPPPKAFDPHPKACNNTLDCFPNLCCLEEGNKFCRPPKRSLLSLLTGFGQRFTNISFIRDLSENLVIR